MSVLILLFALVIWGFVHSLLASYYAKDTFRLAFGAGFWRMYRLAYNLFAVISFLPILSLMNSLHDGSLYAVPSPWNFAMRIGQGLALVLLFVAFVQTDSLSFVGFSQLFKQEESGSLVTRGLYRVVRHPLYTFSLLLIWLSPTVSQNSLTVYIGSTFYVFVGAYFEERKLLSEFGEAYAKYRRETPMLIPGLIFGHK